MKSLPTHDSTSEVAVATDDLIWHKVLEPDDWDVWPAGKVNVISNPGEKA